MSYLKSKFQIGSANGRIEYKSNEQVFHSGDIPPQAKEAKDYIRNFKKSTMLQHSNPPWDETCTPGNQRYDCGVRPAPWDKNKFDDRYFSKTEVETRQAREATDWHNTIHDVDTNTKAIQKHWNKSTAFYDPIFSKHLRDEKELPGYKQLHVVRSLTAPQEKGRRTYTGPTNLGTGQPRVRCLADIAKERENRIVPKKSPLPKDFKTLMERTKIEQKQMRREKARMRRAAAEASARVDPVFYATHNSFPMQHIPIKGDEPAGYQVAAGLASPSLMSTFGSNGQRTFLFGEETLPYAKKSLRKPEEVKESLESTYTSDVLQEYLKSTLNAPQVQPSARRRVMKSGGSAVMVEEGGGPEIVKHFEHRGVWKYSELEDCHTWSCCMNADKDSKGCSSRTIVNQKKWVCRA